MSQQHILVAIETVEEVSPVMLNELADVLSPLLVETVEEYLLRHPSIRLGITQISASSHREETQK